ncbi:MAG: DUF4861 domain-containing protein [Planctomycetes bacterium]|nr:DUF4861 domain-containing protein [Planctomycetota bacterium]
MKYLLQLLCLVATATATTAVCHGADPPKPTTFQRVFGFAGTFDAAMVEKVKALPAGQRLAVDRNGDGKNDELWFIDNDPRHTAARRPILVRVIDEDGDLDTTGPDLDSDLYLADWQADGIVDAVVDYHDEDADGDVDTMGIYYGEYQQPWIDKNVVKVWWSRDVGDDNRLWYDVDYSYEQNACQYRSHFSGDEVFYQLSLENDAPQWLNVFEDPFAFYDPDNDGCSEIALRICAVGHEISSLRYSMDVDNDAHGRNTHDYEFSITALPEKNTLHTNIENTQPFKVRDISVHPVLSWQDARTFARQAIWAKACLTWDEINANTEAQVDRDPHERWEGVINHKSENFPQVGGPPSSPLNKRNEISLKPSRPLRLYYDSTDHRLHLLGANSGWLDVDANLDGTIDARYVYLDTNNDGIFDRRQLDLDADGTIDFDWPMQVKDTQKFELQLAPLTEFYQTSLKQTLTDSQTFIDAAKSVLIDEHKHQDPAADFFTGELIHWMPETRLGERIRKTPGGARFYLDLVRDRLFLALHKQFAGTDKWQKVEGAYQAGDYRAAATNLRGLGISQSTRSPAAFKSYTRRIPLHLDNRNQPQRDDWPVVLNVSEIQKIAPDFTSDRCAIVAPERWLEWRQVAHQVDQLDESVGQEISFLVDLFAGATATSYLYYLPTADHVVDFPIKTGTAEDWTPSNIGWESNRGAYRAYGGQIDFFGKKGEPLIYKNIKQDSYRNETDLGVDALHVGKTSGLGGLTIYQADRAWPVQNPAGEGSIQFTKRVLSQGPVRSAVEIVANNIVPDNPELSVRTIYLIYAEHQETEIRTTISGNNGPEIVLAPGIVKLTREKIFADPATGVFGSWGWQENTIGEIGLGLMVAPQVVIDLRDEPAERRIRCRTSGRGKLRHWLTGNWRRGRRHPTAPTVDNWQQELKQLAPLLLNEVPTKIGTPETLP